MTYLGWLDNAGSWLGHLPWEMAEKRGRCNEQSVLFAVERFSGFWQGIHAFLKSVVVKTVSAAGFEFLAADTGVQIKCERFYPRFS